MNLNLVISLYEILQNITRLKTTIFLGEFPWTVAILKEEQTLGKEVNVYIGSGSLITPGVVLSKCDEPSNPRIC